MIRLFRKTRLQLVAKKKTRRYVKYAVGEVVLLVLGILIALQISNWNQHNLALEKEQAILKSLRNNFAYNLKEVRAINANTKVSYNASIGLLDLIKPEEGNYTIQEVDSLIGSVLNIYTYDPVTGTIDDILKSGHLGLIHNEELKNLISNWSGMVTDLNKDIKITTDHLFGPLTNYLRLHSNMQNTPIPPALMEKTGLHREPHSSFPSDYNVLMSSLEFENLIDFHAVSLIYISAEYVRIEAYLEQTLVLLDAEIE